MIVEVLDYVNMVNEHQDVKNVVVLLFVNMGKKNMVVLFVMIVDTEN
jgi:hypothetical protein